VKGFRDALLAEHRESADVFRVVSIRRMKRADRCAAYRHPSSIGGGT